MSCVTASVYAGAQKNLGPSGVTLVIIREDLLARSQDSLPTMLNYRVHADNNSLYNTPNTFGIYLLGLTMKWLKSLGGLSASQGQLSGKRRSCMRKSTVRVSTVERHKRKAGR